MLCCFNIINSCFFFLPVAICQSSTASFGTPAFLERVNETMSDEYFETNRIKYVDTIVPHTKEALYYRELFEKFYKNQGHVLKEYWMPKWWR